MLVHNNIQLKIFGLVRWVKKQKSTIFRNHLVAPRSACRSSISIGVTQKKFYAANNLLLIVCTMYYKCLTVIFLAHLSLKLLYIFQSIGHLLVNANYVYM